MPDVRQVFDDRALIIASNRGPVSVELGENGDPEFSRGAGGLVTALLGLAQQAETTWIACARTIGDLEWRSGTVHLEEGGLPLRVHFLAPDPVAYEGYYNVIANPLLWFLQHSMWDIPRAPIINRDTWQAWDTGYRVINQLFAEEITRQVTAAPRPALLMLQDYHLYLAPRMVRRMLRERGRGEGRTRLTHFIHIPWPGPEDWGLLPEGMRLAILEGLTAVDLLGFQTQEDGLNFIRTCESHLPGAHVNFREGRVWYRNRSVHVRDFPISIDVQALRAQAEQPEIEDYEQDILRILGGRKMILRIDRIEPSKNIVRGFQAYDEMLELHPELRGEVKFLALLVPSRLGVDEYQNYLDELMAAAGRVNAKFGTSEWEPVRILVGDNYPRAVAALQCYDVLLVNSIADGMNLVAKEGPVVNKNDGVLVLSERTGAHQQLGPGALVISPLDVYATAQALHQALTMGPEGRRERAAWLRESIEREDIAHWLDRQLRMLAEMKL
jgi:trehalose 6-phosphate synthase